MKIVKTESHYLIHKDDGTNVILTGCEAGLLLNFIRKETLRDMINDQVNSAEDDWLDLSKYEFTRDDFIQEIFEALEDEIDYGNNVDEMCIDDKIEDLAGYYGLEREV